MVVDNQFEHFRSSHDRRTSDREMAILMNDVARLGSENAKDEERRDG